MLILFTFQYSAIKIRKDKNYIYLQEQYVLVREKMWYVVVSAGAKIFCARYTFRKAAALTKKSTRPKINQKIRTT